MDTHEPLGWNVPTAADRRTFCPETVFEAGLRHFHIANTAYPIHHQTTMRAYRASRAHAQAMASAAWQGTDSLGLYVHVPFCQSRCKYCEYAVVDRAENGAEDAYFDALLRELESYARQVDTSHKTLIGFDIGGGTPAFARPANIARVVEAVRRAFRFEPGMTISTETTPRIAQSHPESMQALKDIGIDRISMGVQTTHHRLAKSMEREYATSPMLEEAVRNIREAGFHRFNIDLMFGFADQTPEGWAHSVREAIALGPEYITLYRVRHKGTRIQEQAARVSLQHVNRLEGIARDMLLAAGFAGTPGKNTYSRVPGDLGTSDYLTERVVKGTPYLGLGLGAQSFSQHTLSYNQGAAAKALRPYIQAVDAGLLPVQDIYHLPLDVAMAKMIAVSFYFGGIYRDHFASKFGVTLEEHFPQEIDFVLARGLMEYEGSTLRLTLTGADRFSGVVALFYAGAVKDYLVNLTADGIGPRVHQRPVKETRLPAAQPAAPAGPAPA